MAKKDKFDSLDDVLDPNDVYVTLDLDNGDELECKVISIFEACGRDYVALLPLDDAGNPSDSDVFLYRYYEDAEGNPSLEFIDDDDEFEIASDRFDEIQDEAEFDEM